jgi:putative ABC transport system permease protein
MIFKKRRRSAYDTETGECNLKYRPPRLAGWILRFVLREGEFLEKSGDLEEVYSCLVDEVGTFKAGVWFWYQVLRAVPVFVMNSICWRGIMFKNYLKTALRNIQKQKGFSLINMTGLAISMACCILIFLYVHHEMSFDDYHEDADSIYRIVTQLDPESEGRLSSSAQAPLVTELKENFPEVEFCATTHYGTRTIVKRADIISYEDNLMYATEDVFDIFNVKFRKGDPLSLFNNPRSVVITNRMSQKYFGNENPEGNTLQINGNDYLVVGVVENPPRNTHLRYDFVVPMVNFEPNEYLTDWTIIGFNVYAKLLTNTDVSNLKAKLERISDDYLSDKNKGSYAHFLQPLKTIHLNPFLKKDIGKNMIPTNIKIITTIGFMILLIACFNFINLSTARSMKRAREVGMRKIVGARQSQLLTQFLVESLLYCILSSILALLISILLIPHFNLLCGIKFLAVDLFQSKIVVGMACVVLFAGLIAGMYPSFVLTFFQPVSVFKGLSISGSSGTVLKKILVVAQFAISIFLIIVTIVISRQLHFMKNEPLGFDKEQKLTVPARFDGNHSIVKYEFLKHPNIAGVTFSWTVPGKSEYWSVGTRLIGEEETKEWNMKYNFVDYNYFSEFRIPLVGGRSFKQDNATDERGAFIVNETAVKTFGWSSPEAAIGKRIQGLGRSPEHIREIVGVVSDYHFRGLQHPVEPLVFIIRPPLFRTITFTIKSSQIEETLSFIRGKWYELHLGNLFEYYFLDEEFDRWYTNEEKVYSLIFSFTVLAVFLSCIGLFGLASYAATQRVKEIGIRKVLGASVTQVNYLLSREFMKYVFIGNCFAWPVAYFTMNKWLQNFAYRIRMSVWIFIFSGLAALTIALLIVGYQTIKAATSNPVDSLRYE